MNAIELDTDIKSLLPEETLKTLRAEAVRRKIPLARLIVEVLASASKEIVQSVPHAA